MTAGVYHTSIAEEALTCVGNKNRFVNKADSALIKVTDLMMSVNRMKAESYLQKKWIASPGVVAARLDETGLDKIECLIEGDKNISNGRNYFLVHFDNFATMVPAWGRMTHHWIDSSKTKRKRTDEVVNFFWSQFSPEQINRVMVILKQNSGLSYLHAPVVYEHYLVVIATACACSGIINIGKYADSLLRGYDLKNFLLQDMGGDSLETLHKICNLTEDDCDSISIPNKDKYPIHYAEVCEIILQKISLNQRWYPL